MTGANAVYKAEERLQAILKAIVVGGRTVKSQRFRFQPSG